MDEECEECEAPSRHHDDALFAIDRPPKYLLHDLTKQVVRNQWLSDTRPDVGSQIDLFRGVKGVT